MVKNNYPLLLIMNLINNIGSKRVFTKMDLQQRFNNVKIKEEDQQKRTFTTHVEFFEPTVMLFRMTNSLAIFQTIMNKILRNMINKGKVVAFMDNVLVETETEKEHNKIVKEILKKL